MSTIATPRDPPRRVASVANTITTPTSSNRPSLETSRSATSSPNPNQSTTSFQTTAGPAPGRRNRAALREFYNLKKHPNPTTTHPALAGAATPPVILESGDDAASIASSSGIGGGTSFSEVSFSELDTDKFDADAYVRRALAENSLEELLRTYAKVLGEIRALDAEKKALVYDNYSKLITATETIRKMRANMDPLTPMASTLDPAIARIYTQASAIRDSIRASVPLEATDQKTQEEQAKRKRLQRLAREVLDTPERIRDLIKEGRIEDAKQGWQMPKKLLETWREKGAGGDEVLACLEDGEAALRGEETGYQWRKGDEDEDEDDGSGSDSEVEDPKRDD
ncbi:hypothetical protein MKZ38_003955 [Zalerion maritima]|uniref:Vacuolar protein sorting-associated protein 51 homolog n=1 Tax=Zalerion maritima TaxID=339359 RepID=A0AAD5RN04_9PEZI|nr:hypothetical protein MKZ38_003955 [Zalerion maritima]